VEKQPTKEQIEEFWLWCGWQLVPSGGVASPKQLALNRPFIAGDFPKIDLNNLFEYAVPMLGFVSLRLHFKPYGTHMIPSGFWEAIVEDNPKDKIATMQYVERHKNPALALFWAIEKVRNDKEMPDMRESVKPCDPS